MAVGVDDVGEEGGIWERVEVDVDVEWLVGHDEGAVVYST